ncbi:MAG: peptidyl-tRNA hydrolase [Thermoleophilaceae bacterium]
MPLVQDIHSDDVTAERGALVMYFVVRKDLPLGLGQAMAAAGAAAVRCSRRFEHDERFAPAFGAWRESSFRKVALRASADELERIRAEHPSVDVGEWLLCLPPLHRDHRSELLASLRPFTDAPRPAEPSPALPGDVPAMLYVIRPGVMKTAGKAMAQAGHASLMCESRWAERAPEAFTAWHDAGEPGEVVHADDAQWELLRDRCDGVVVRDGGLTQVEPGTETAVALVPEARDERPELVRSLERVP